MKARQILSILLAVVLLGCQSEPTAPDPKKIPAVPGCGACPPFPGPGEAYFTLGEPEFFAGTDSFVVGVHVSTSENITFSQFTVDFRSDCLEFLSAARSASFPGPSPFVNEGPGTPSFPVYDPGADRHVLVNVSGAYGPGCRREILRLRFRVVAPTPALCWLRWDESTPGGNPPNHLVTNLPSQIRPESIEFCDRVVFYGRPSGCQCPPEPPVGGADLAIGAPQFSGSDVFEVGLLVNTPQNIVFSQFTVDYRSDRLQFVGATRGANVPPGAAPFTNDGPGTPSFPVNDPQSDRHVLASFTADYGPGCHLEILRLQFRVVTPLPATSWLRWDDSSPAGNPPSHLITDDPAQIRSETIFFCDREIDLGPPQPGVFTLLAMNDVDQLSGVDELARIPDRLTGVAHVIGGLGDGFRDTEAMTTQILPSTPTRIFAVDDDRLLAIDPRSGRGTLVGPIGYDNVDGIAFHPRSGVLYGVTQWGNQIILIDTATGQGTLQRSHVVAGHPLEDLAFHPLSGEAYILAGVDPRLVKVDLDTGAERTLNLSGATSLESLVWSMDGTTLYSAADRAGFKDLVTIDATTGAISFVSAAHSGLDDIEALAWIPSAELAEPSRAQR